MRAQTRSVTISILTAVLCLGTWAYAASPTSLAGGIVGQVKNASGIAQMGATVYLYNRYDRLVRQALTNERGRFAFDTLAPDLYSIRVTLASFVPAIRRNIAVAAGSDDVLQIDLATLLSSVDLVTSSPSRGVLMTDDWKWVLRSSQSTRPVLRFLPEWGASSSHPAASIFSETSGVVNVSAGGGESFTTGNEQDLGTAFALATSLYGSSRLQFSGNLGYGGNAGIPTAGFRTSYSRKQEGGSSPEFTLTVRQLYLPNHAEQTPVLRTMSAAVMDKLELGEGLRIEYGLSLDSVQFLQHLNYASPFARLTYDVDAKSALRLAFSSGAEPTELVSRGRQGRPEAGEAENDLRQDLAALAVLPRISRRDGEAQVQRTRSFEAGYQRVQGSRTYSAAVYQQTVSNAAFTMSGASDFVSSSDTLPDLASRSLIFNAGTIQDFGYMAGATQSLGDHMEVSLSAGRGGGLMAGGTDSNGAEDVRAAIHQVRRTWVTARVSGTGPRSGTYLMTDYGWTDPHALMPAHLFLTQQSGAQQVNPETGWNIRVRQPIPTFVGLPVRLEATGELRNLMAQGYLPLAASGKHAVITNAPRAVRGGLSFIF